MKSIFSHACLWLLACPILLAQKQGIVEREFFIPWVEAQPSGLDSLLVYFKSPGKHPLVVLTHGTSGDGVANSEVTPWQELPQAVWFARRGWIALVVVRRGYGNSDGATDRASTRSGLFPDHRQQALSWADDMRRAIEYMRSFPEVDGTRIIAAGVSAGGLTTVALTADAPAGLVAAINFSGGLSPRTDSTVRAYGYFGRSSRVPMLWLYSQNDRLFGPELARRFEAAFRAGGGQDQLVLEPPVGNDGHRLFGDIPMWSGRVDDFLRAQHLVFLPKPLPEPAPPDIPPPPGLSAQGLKEFHNYLLAGPHKAFAMSRNFVGVSSANITPGLACTQALDGCTRASKGTETGRVVFMDDTAVSP